MCVSPGHVWVEQGPNWIQLPRPCRDCWQCRENWTSDYVGRGLAEAYHSEWVASLTLTYAPRDDLAEKVVTPEHFQKFVRAMRRRDHVIRYFAAGEYGEANGRAHFHCVIFGKTANPRWPEEKRFWIPEWPHGHVWNRSANADKGVRYAAKYVGKRSEEGPLAGWHTMSKKPPLGWTWFKDRALLAFERGVFPKDFEYSPPGAATNKRYMMTGATRRDYLLLVHDLWTEHYGGYREKDLNEWVAACLASALKWRHKQAWLALSPQKRLDFLKDTMRLNFRSEAEAERLRLKCMFDMQLADAVRKAEDNGWPAIDVPENDLSRIFRQEKRLSESQRRSLKALREQGG